MGKFFPREAVIDFTITGSKKACIETPKKWATIHTDTALANSIIG